jgi:hypothetical protein
MSEAGYERQIRKTMTQEEWEAQGRALFGSDKQKWRFTCPSCGHVASVEEWKVAGAPHGTAAFSCIGRFTGANGDGAFKGKGGPCNYAGGGLFKLNPIRVITKEGTEHDIFAFAEPPNV